MTDIQYPNQKPLALPAFVEIGDGDIEEAIAAWRRNPPEEAYTNILDAETVTGDAADDLPKFTFDKITQRYRNLNTGKFISDVKVRELTRAKISQVIGDINTIADLLVQGKISVSTWESGTRDALKVLHIQTYTLGIGGQKNLTQRDYGIIGNQLQKQYEYLNGFANDLISKGMTEAQFKARLQLYANASRQAYERGKLEGHKRNGFSWEKRIRTKTESCDPCISYEARGWQPIGTLPEPTQECECRSNCGCYKIYSSERQKPTDSLLRHSWGWVV